MSFKSKLLPLEKIHPSPYQSRFDFGDIDALAKNINDHGLQNPIVVRKLPNKQYELISGARRVEAARLLGWKTIPATIRDISDSEAATLTLSENLQRENLNPIEEARGYQILIETLHKTHDEVAAIAGKSRPYITNSLSLLKSDEFLQACLICDKLSLSHVRLINSAPDEIPKYRLADITIDRGLSVRELEEAVHRLQDDALFISWKRNIPITRIKIPASACEMGIGLAGDDIIIDARFHLLDGFMSLRDARNKGNKTIDVTMIYFTEWLKPNGAWKTVTSKKASSTPSTEFAKTLSMLIGDVDAMHQRYPLHYIKNNEDYIVMV